MKRKANKSEEIYHYIVKFTKEHLYPPSVREIGDGVNLKSTSSVYHYLKLLEEDGLIRLGEFSQPRAIHLVGYEFKKKTESG